MTEPAEHLIDGRDAPTLGQNRSRDHDDRYPELTGRYELGVSPHSARISRHQPLNAVPAQEVALTRDRERSALDDDARPGERWVPLEPVNEAERVDVLRPAGEGGDMLSADGEEYVRSLLRQCGGGGLEVRDVDPPVSRRLGPFRPLESETGDARGLAGGDGIAAHLAGEGVRGIDDVRVAVLVEEARETFRTPEATFPHGQRLRCRHGRAPGVRVEGIDAALRQRRREAVGILRSTENEDAHRV